MFTCGYLLVSAVISFLTVQLIVTDIFHCLIDHEQNF